MQVELMNQVEATSKRSEKERLLAKADKETQLLLRYALDPYLTYGVTLNNNDVVVASSAGSSPTRWWSSFCALLDQLSQRRLTGNAAVSTLLEHLHKASSVEDVKWALRVLNRDLRCGVSVKTLQKVFPGLIQPFEVALAQGYDDSKHTLQGVGFIEPKLDGLRVTVVDGMPLTRNGNPVQSTHQMLDELASMITKRHTSLRDWVFDGEFIGSGTFEETVSKARATGQEDRGLVYNIFDIVSANEWQTRKTRPFSARRRDVNEHIHDGVYIRRVPSIRVEDPTVGDVLNFCDKFMAQGYEGAMWKADLPYAFKRSSALLKVKKFETEDAKIIGFEEGTGKYEGLLGALVVQLEDGTQVKVGSGFNDAQREAFWTEQQTFKGKTVEVKFQNKTAKGSLRFPIYLRWRDDK